MNTDAKRRLAQIQNFMNRENNLSRINSFYTPLRSMSVGTSPEYAERLYKFIANYTVQRGETIDLVADWASNPSKHIGEMMQFVNCFVGRRSQLQKLMVADANKHILESTKKEGFVND